jgi:ParB family chromosome partitioning protein
MQNLTVVPAPAAPGDRPEDAEYTVVIGHRRLAAAVAAGLETVPCRVADMDRKEQVATMLVENIQRADLTPIEQAESFQLMLDLGETVASVAERTGFSADTVRHRVELFKLPKDLLAEAVEERQVTLTDLARLEKVESVETRAQLLKFAGRPSFEAELAHAVAAELADKRWKDVKPLVQAWAAPSGKEYSWDIKGYTVSYDLSFDLADAEPPAAEDCMAPKGADLQKKTHVYHRSPGNTRCTILTKIPARAAGEKAEKDPDLVEHDRRKHAKQDIEREMYEKRASHVAWLLSPDGNCDNDDVGFAAMPVAAEVLFRNIGEKSSPTIARLIEARGVFTLEGKEYIPPEDVLKYTASWTHEHLLFLAVYATLDRPDLAMANAALYPTPRIKPLAEDEYSGIRLRLLYRLLEKTGYEASEEERRILDGTHELFQYGDGAEGEDAVRRV